MRHLVALDLRLGEALEHLRLGRRVGERRRDMEGALDRVDGVAHLALQHAVLEGLLERHDLARKVARERLGVGHAAVRDVARHGGAELLGVRELGESVGRAALERDRGVGERLRGGRELVAQLLAQHRVLEALLKVCDAALERRQTRLHLGHLVDARVELDVERLELRLLEVLERPSVVVRRKVRVGVRQQLLRQLRLAAHLVGEHLGRVRLSELARSRLEAIDKLLQLRQALELARAHDLALLVVRLRKVLERLALVRLEVVERVVEILQRDAGSILDLLGENRVAVVLLECRRRS